MPMKRRYRPDYTNSEIANLIDELIHNALYRQILKDRLIDGLTYERIAEKHDLTDISVKRIVYRAEDKLFKKL